MGFISEIVTNELCDGFTGDEDIVVEALDVLQECIEMEQPLVNDHIEVRSPVIIISRSLQSIWRV
jgi:hypothetical protein